MPVMTGYDSCEREIETDSFDRFKIWADRTMGRGEVEIICGLFIFRKLTVLCDYEAIDFEKLRKIVDETEDDEFDEIARLIKELLDKKFAKALKIE